MPKSKELAYMKIVPVKLSGMAPSLGIHVIVIQSCSASATSTQIISHSNGKMIKIKRKSEEIKFSCCTKRPYLWYDDKNIEDNLVAFSKDTSSAFQGHGH